ncbi:hypothetical protein ABZ913_22710, partial [Streptosporangium sandarakinum]
PYEQPPMPPIPAGFDPPRPTVPPLRAPDSYEPVRLPEPGSVTPVIRVRPAEPPELPKPADLVGPDEPSEAPRLPELPEPREIGRPGAAETGTPEIFAPSSPSQAAGITAVPGLISPRSTGSDVTETGESVTRGPVAADEPKADAAPEPASGAGAGTGPAGTAPAVDGPAEIKAPAAETKEEPRPEPVTEAPITVPAARVDLDQGPRAEQAKDEPRTGAAAKEPPAEKSADPPAPPASPKPAPARPAKKARGRRASVPTWDEIMFGARHQD